MSTPVVINGVTYQQPTQGTPKPWGTTQAQIILALAAACLQKTGGSFTLSAEVDFGSTYGLKSAYFKSRTTNPASSGIVRLANNEGISWRDVGNSSNKVLRLNSSDLLEFDGTAIPTQSYVTGQKTLSATTNLGSDGLFVTLTAGDTVAFGDVCRINSSGQAKLIDADAIATMGGVVMCVDSTITATASGKFMLFGLANNTSWTWTPGSLLYGTTTGTTTNTMSHTPPSGSSDVVQILGVAISATLVLFKPELAQVELA